MRQRFRGSHLVTLDDRGRIKVPAPYLAILESQYNRQVYITSINGDNVLLYPLPVWEEIESQIERIAVRDPDMDEFVNRLSYWGCESELDPKGRVLVPPALRDAAQLQDTVLVLGSASYLVLWNRQNFEGRFMTGSFTDERLQKIARLIHESASLSRHEP
jgi:MraZ protein